MGPWMFRAMIADAMKLAHDRGMALVPCPTDPALARIRCRKCGWPHTEPGIYDVLLRRYVLAPHGCYPCEWEKTHGHPPRVSFNGHHTWTRQPG